MNLRILPLGDSITKGEGSSDGNGYRSVLRDSIVAGGNSIRYIGRVKPGNMTNNDNEGHRGFPIGSVGNTGEPDFLLRPNIVLLMAGTNDVRFNFNLDTTLETLGKLVDRIVVRCPDAAVLVATITPLLEPPLEAKRVAYNSAVRSVVKARGEAGNQVALVDMGKVMPNHINSTDMIHPNDEGYRLIAAAWLEAIQAAGKKGWIREPMPADSPVDQQESKPEPVEALARSPAWVMGQVLAFAVALFVVFVVVWKTLVLAFRRYGRTRNQ